MFSFLPHACTYPTSVTAFLTLPHTRPLQSVTGFPSLSVTSLAYSENHGGGSPRSHQMREARGTWFIYTPGNTLKQPGITKSPHMVLQMDHNSIFPETSSPTSCCMEVKKLWTHTCRGPQINFFHTCLTQGKQKLASLTTDWATPGM